MAYDTKLADRVREYLAQVTSLNIEEKEMFRGIAFMVNDKMCVNVSGDNLMCRYDPVLTEELAERNGYLPMIMKGKEMKGYCYVEPIGFKTKKDFQFWIGICLDFNERAKSSKKRSKS
ncbi:MAG: TfoX/Sxy family protein [Sediminibacterium sp.]|nr:TfoX/Sxy family protein [uncultured Sediminibacterium sp.]